MLSFQKVEFYHKWMNHYPAGKYEAQYVVYHTNFGNISSCSTWMVPGTWSED